METPRCPYCNRYIDYDFMGDEHGADDAIFQYWIGFCEQCGKRFHWTEIYTLSDIEDFEEELDV